jgi:uncharacterized protein involved in type VI secretion and phage assembly
MSTDSIIDLLSQGRDREAQASKIYGFVVGIVTNNVDPKKLGRIKVRFPWLSKDVESWWARIIYPMGGKERGYWWIPEIDDEVLVGFEHGDVRFPYIIGSLYNGKDVPPICHDVTNKFGKPKGYDHGPYPTKGRDWNEDGNDDLRFIRSRSGHLFIMDDKRGKEKITLTNNSGGNRIEIFTDKKKVVITSDDGDIELIAKENILMRCKNLITESWEDHSFHAYRDYIVQADRDSTHKANRNVSREAGKNMDDKAGKQRTAKSGANTIIKGSKVFIN